MNHRKPVNRVTATPPRNTLQRFPQNEATTAAPQPVPALLEFLDRRVKELAEAVDSIERVIDAVCTPQTPSPGAATPVSAEMDGTSPVADRIRTACEQVRHTTGRLHFLTARVEL